MSAEVFDRHLQEAITWAKHIGAEDASSGALVHATIAQAVATERLVRALGDLDNTYSAVNGAG